MAMQQPGGNMFADWGGDVDARASAVKWEMFANDVTRETPPMDSFGAPASSSQPSSPSPTGPDTGLGTVPAPTAPTRRVPVCIDDSASPPTPPGALVPSPTTVPLQLSPQQQQAILHQQHQQQHMGGAIMLGQGGVPVMAVPMPMMMTPGHTPQGGQPMMGVNQMAFANTPTGMQMVMTPQGRIPMGMVPMPNPMMAGTPGATPTPGAQQQQPPQSTAKTPGGSVRKERGAQTPKEGGSRQTPSARRNKDKGEALSPSEVSARTQQAKLDAERQLWAKHMSAQQTGGLALPKMETPTSAKKAGVTPLTNMGGGGGSAVGPDSATGALPWRPTYKTKLCKTFVQQGSCKYGEKCMFAHGDVDLCEVKEIANTPPVTPGGARGLSQDASTPSSKVFISTPVAQNSSPPVVSS